MRYIYFGHHKCASRFIGDIISNVAHRQGLRILNVSLTDALPYGYHRKFKYRLKWVRTKWKLRHRAYDILIQRNANASVLKALDRIPFRGFHVIRDPRDVLVSAYFSHLYSHPLDAPWLCEHRRRLQQLSKEEGLLCELEKFTAVHLEEMWHWPYDNPRVLETRFELLITRPVEEWTRILGFLGLAYEPADMQMLVTDGFEKAAQRKRGTENPFVHYRKGIIGDWRNHLTPRIIDRIKASFGVMLIDLGYESGFDW